MYQKNEKQNPCYLAQCQRMLHKCIQYNTSGNQERIDIVAIAYPKSWGPFPAVSSLGDIDKGSKEKWQNSR